MYTKYLNFIFEQELNTIKIKNTNIFYNGIKKIGNSDYAFGYIGEPHNTFEIALKYLQDPKNTELYHKSIIEELASYAKYKKLIVKEFDNSVKYNLEDITFLIKYYKAWQTNDSDLWQDIFDNQQDFKSEYARLYELYKDIQTDIKIASTKKTIEKGIDYLKNKNYILI